MKIHTCVEEEIFYPTVCQALNQDEEDEEHRVAKTVIEALENKNPSDVDFCAKFTVLAENVRHHIKEEEEMFPEAKETEVDFKELGERMQARKDELMGSEAELEEAVGKSEVKPYQELG